MQLGETFTLESNNIDELYESMDLLGTFKEFGSLIKSLWDISVEQFISGIKTLGRLGLEILRFIGKYTVQAFKTDLRELIKNLVYLKRNLNENVVVDILGTILRSKVFWILLLFLFVGNVFGAVSTIVSAKAALSATAGVAGVSSVTVAGVAGASTATLNAAISSGIASVFVNLFLAVASAVAAMRV